MGFAVIHATKVKGGSGGLGSHIDRDTIPDNANKEKTAQNMELCEVTESLHKSISTRIEEGYTGTKAVRKDAVRAISFVLSGSHERMKEIESDRGELLNWAKDNYDFIKDEFGEENMVRCSLHLDEKTPHIHAVVVPITKEGRLTAKPWLDGKKKLKELQDRYAEKMKKWGLERGLSNSNRKHVKTKEFYRYLRANDMDAKKVLESPHALKIVSQALQELQGKEKNKNIEQSITSNKNHYERQVFEGNRAGGAEEKGGESHTRTSSRSL